MLKTGKEKKISLIIVLVVFLYIFYAYVCSPLIQNVKQKNLDIENKKNTLASLEQAEKRLQKDSAQIKLLRKEIIGLNNNLISTYDVSEIIMEFYSLLLQNNLTSPGFEITDLQKGKDYNFLLLKFRAGGSKENMENFIKTLEDYDRSISINLISLQCPTESAFESDFSLKLYTFKETRPNKINIFNEFMEGRYGTVIKWYDAFSLVK